MAEKEKTERRVYVLPTELVDRIRRFQLDNKIPSEVEAVRRLIDTSLHLRDDVDSILEKFHNKFDNEKDLRVLSRDILSTHPLVSTIQHEQDSVVFILQDRSKGKFRLDGKGFTWSNFGDNWEEDDHIPF